jgi:phenylacetate-CoA ligase
LLFLARYKQKHPEFAFQPHAIATTGNTLHKVTRDEIETAFGCKIYDAYSCEGNSNVSECSTHECYHSSVEYGISEVINDKGEHIIDGVGRLISTDLHNFAHPFIRFDTQDLIEVSSAPCSCGRCLLRVNRIIGRDNDIITSASGQKFIVHNFTGFFQTDMPEVNQSVDQFQVIKTKESQIVFNIVVNNKYDESVKNFIAIYWGKQLHLPIVINVVDEIPLTKSGKRRFIINEP